MDIVIRYNARSKQCKDKCGDDDFGMQIYCEDKTITKDSIIYRGCGCVLDKVNDRFHDPDNWECLHLEYYFVKMPFYYDVICKDCINNHVHEERVHFSQHLTAEELDGEFPSDLSPRTTYEFLGLNRENHPLQFVIDEDEECICNECEQLLYTLNMKCDDVSTEPLSDFGMDYESHNNMSPIPSFIVTDNEYCVIPPSTPTDEIDYLASLYTDTPPHSHSPPTLDTYYDPDTPILYIE